MAFSACQTCQERSGQSSVALFCPEQLVILSGGLAFGVPRLIGPAAHGRLAGVQ